VRSGDLQMGTVVKLWQVTWRSDENFLEEFLVKELLDGVHTNILGAHGPLLFGHGAVCIGGGDRE
jgi:hypothetical protein